MVLPSSVVVLVAGDCKLCSGFVKFVAARDPRGACFFVTQQSDEGQMLLQAHGRPVDLTTIVTIERYPETAQGVGHATASFVKSTAVLRAMRVLCGLWWLLAAFLLVPCALRDCCYDLVARNRIALFGRQEACALPPAVLRKQINRPVPWLAEQGKVVESGKGS